MTRTLRAGVAGAGVFGGHHARKLLAAPDVALAGIYDRGTGRALELARSLDAPGYVDMAAFLDDIDVLTVAAPASAHFRLAAAALDAGVHVYVEKPLAASLEDADRLVDRAEAAGLVLACGHQERAVFAAMGLFDVPERPTAVRAIRRTAFHGRNMDVSAALDLMIHDIDLVLTLAGPGRLSVSADGRRTRGERLDAVTASLTIGDLTADLDVDRDMDEPWRQMRLTYPSGEVEIDFLQRTFRNDAGFDLDAAFGDTDAGRDPLGVSVAAFLAAVRGDAERPLVTGREARDALAVALAVDAVAEFQLARRGA